VSEEASPDEVSLCGVRGYKNHASE